MQGNRCPCSEVDPTAVLGYGEIRELPVGQLNRRTSAVIRSLRDGERLVVTRHHEPLAVLLTVRDAMELIAAARLGDARRAALNDLAAEKVYEPWPKLRDVRILVARAAAARFHRTAAQDRFALRRLLIRGEVNLEGPYWVPSGRLLVSLSGHFPAGEEDRRDEVLIHDLIDARELERELIGEEIWQARARRDHDRCIHARRPRRAA